MLGLILVVVCVPYTYGVAVVHQFSAAGSYARNAVMTSQTASRRSHSNGSIVLGSTIAIIGPLPRADLFELTYPRVVTI